MAEYVSMGAWRSEGGADRNELPGDGMDDYVRMGAWRSEGGTDWNQLLEVRRTES